MLVQTRPHLLLDASARCVPPPAAAVVVVRVASESESDDSDGLEDEEDEQLESRTPASGSSY